MHPRQSSRQVRHGGADPRVVWDALAATGYNPHGKPTDFYSRCPAHDGDGRSLHVTTTPDGHVLLHCFAYGCKAEEIVERIGVRMVDLFPTDWRQPRQLQRARRDDFTGYARTVVDMLLALERLKSPWRVEVKFDECPNCEAPHTALVIDPDTAFIHCARGCSPAQVLNGLADRLRQRRRR